MNNLVEKRSDKSRFADRRMGLLGLLAMVAVILAAVTPSAKGQAPANNNFTNATDLGVIGTPGTLSGSSANATRETNEPIHYIGSPLSARSVWFKWTAPADGVATFDTIGSSFDTVLAAYILAGTNGLASLVKIASDDDMGASGFALSSLITFPVMAGTNYYIAIDGYRAGLFVSGDSGPYVLNWRMGSNPFVPPDTIRLSSSTYSVSEAGGFATITVLYGGDSTGTNAFVSVDFSTADGTAINGTHYVATNGTLVFAPGETEKTFEVPVLDNFTFNANRTVFIFLSNPTNGVQIDPVYSSAVLTIFDNEGGGFSTAGVFSFSSSFYYATENETSPAPFGGLAPAVSRSASTFLRDVNLPGVAHRSPYGVVITVTRSTPAVGRVLVDYATEIRPAATNVIGPVFGQTFPAKRNVDFTPVSGSLVFDDYQMSASFIVPVFSNFISNNASAVFDVVLSNPRPAPEEEIHAAGQITPGLGSLSRATVQIYEVNATFKRFNFERALYRYDEYNPRLNNGPYTNNVRSVVVDVLLPGGGGGTIGVRMLHNTAVGYLHELEAGSDYATLDEDIFPQTPYTDGTPPIVTESDFSDFQDTTLTFPGNGPLQFRQRATFTITNDSTVEFNEDIRFDLVNVPDGFSAGPALESTATILFDDQPAGAADREWNPEGVYYTQPPFNPSPGANNSVSGVAVQEDGRTVIVGDFTAVNTVSRNRIARLNANGSLDESFNPGSGANGPIDALVLYPTNVANVANMGKILVGGSFTSFNGVPRRRLARLNADGSLDETFNVGNGANLPVRSIALQSDGKVIVAGDFELFNDLSVNGIMRLNEDGSLDDSFDPGAGADDAIWSVVVRDGAAGRSIYVAGEFQTFDGQLVSHVARLNSDGSVDSSFNPGVSVNGPVYAMVVDTNSRVLLGGAFTQFHDSPRSSIVRLLSNGTLDLDFHIGTGADDSIYALTLQPDGKILIGGEFQSYNGTRRMGIARLFSNGALDTSFMDTGYNQFAGLIKTFSFDPPRFVNSIALQADGNVMIGGSFTHLGGNPSYDNPAFAFENLHAPFTRAQKVPRFNVARLIGGYTHGPGNIEFDPIAAPFSIDENSDIFSAPLRRVDGRLGSALASSDFTANTAELFEDFSGSAFDAVWREAYFVAPRSVGFTGFEYFQIPIFDDTLREGDETFELSTANVRGSINLGQNFFSFFSLGGEYIPLGAARGYYDTVRVTIADNDFDHGEFNFAQADFVVDENSGQATITVIRTNGTSGDVSVRVLVQNGTAVAGQDYVPPIDVQTLTFVSGQTTNTFTVQLLDNPQIELDETIVLVLTNATAGARLPGGLPTSTATATVTIVDNDFLPGRVRFATAGFTNSESDRFAAVVVRRMGGSAGVLSVNFQTLNGVATAPADFTATNGTLSWSSGDRTSRTILIPLVSDGIVEGNETFTVRLSSPSVANALGDGTNVLDIEVTIADGDAYGTLSFSQFYYEADENGQPPTITIVRSGGIGGTVSVDFATAPGTAIESPAPDADFIGTNGTLVFLPGELSRTFRVRLVDDATNDGPKTVQLTLSNAINATVGLGNAQLFIVDNEDISTPAGSLDTTFSTASGANGAVFSLALQFDGGIIMAGEFTEVGTVPRNRIARLRPDGTLDPTFDIGPGANGPIRALALQSDGRLVVGGGFTTINSTNAGNLARLAVDGKVDGAFNPGAGADNPVLALAIQPNDKVLVGGSFSTFDGEPHPGLVRLNTNGVVDATFNTGSGFNGTVYAIALQSDGKIVVGGEFISFNGLPQTNIARLHTDGRLDTTFNSALSINGPVRALLVQSDGKIVVGGSFTSVNGATRLRLARLEQNGVLDATFLAGSSMGADGTVNAIKQQIDGKLVIAGEFRTFNGVTRNGITRLRDSDGGTDPTINFGNGANAFVSALLIQPDRKIVLGGGFTEYDDQPRRFIARIYGGAIAGPGTLEFSAAEYFVSEGGTNALITVSRRGGTEGTVSAVYSMLDGTALAGVDYQPAAGTVVFSEGETRRTFIIPIIPNGLADGNRTAYVQLTDFVGASAGLQPSALLTILDDESVISFSTIEYSVNENSINQKATIGVTRSGGTNSTVSVRFTTANGTATAGSDYLGTNGIVLFEPGEVFKNFNVVILNDATSETNETIQLSLTSLSTSALLGISNALLVVVDDDFSPGRFAFSRSNFVVDEFTGNAVLTILRLNGSSGPASVRLRTLFGSATPGADYVATNELVTFADGQTNAFVTIRIIDDALTEPSETLPVQIFGATGGASIGLADAVVTIADNDAPGTFVLSQAIYSTSESNGFATITVLRTSGNVGTVGVTIQTSGGSATPSVDYTPVTTTLTFAPGQTVRTANIPILQDTLAEGTETIGLLLSGQTGGASIGTPGSGILRIIDDEVAVGFSVTNYTVIESSTNVVITVIRTGETNNGFSVIATATDGTATANLDFAGSSTTLEFAPGETSRTFTVTVFGDQVAEGDEFLNLTLSSASGVALGPIATARLTILDDDMGFSFSSATYFTNEGALDLLVTVTRSGSLGTTAWVEYATFDGTAMAGLDYLGSTGRLDFASNQNIGTFTVRILDDTLVEGDETVNLFLANPSPGTSLGAQSTAVITISDNDAAVGFSPTSYVVNEKVTNAVITVVRRGNAAQTVSVTFRTANGSAVSGVDYGFVTTTILWASNDISPRTVLIPIFDDTLAEGAETVILQLLNPVGAALDPTTGSGILTIVDNAGVIAFASANPTVVEGSGNALINLVRTGGSNGTVSVQWNIVGGSATPGQDYFGAVGTVVFASGETTKAILLPIGDDGIVEGIETVNFVLSNAGGGARVGSPDTATLSIIDNDAGIIVGAGSALIFESFPPTNNVIEPGETVTLLFALRNAGIVHANNVTASLVQTNGITFTAPQTQSYGALLAGGNSVSRPFTFTAQGTNGSRISATLMITNNGLFLGVVSFDFVLGKVNIPIQNANAITINDFAPASPFPALLTVSGVSGPLNNLTVTLHGMSHLYPDDVDMLLVAPNGQTVMLMSDAGGGNPNAMNNVTVTFDDSAPGAIPDVNRITNGVYRPGNYLIQGDPFPSPAPAPPYGTTLNSLNGIDPNGIWRLFIVDDSARDEGFISAGWSLNIAASGPVVPGADLSVSVSDFPDPVAYGGTFIYTVAVTNHGPSAASSVTLNNILPPQANFISVAGPGSYSQNGNVLMGNLGNLPIGGGAVVTITMTARNENALLTLDSTVGAGEADLNPGNNHASVQTTVNGGVGMQSLSVARKNSELVLSWQGTSTNAVLQASATLDGTWNDMPASPAASNGVMSVTVPVETGVKFFRLRRAP